jgi:hypothetical protein
VSYITLPDQHPGRCLNHRGILRCLEAEGTEHVCRFPAPRRLVKNPMHAGSFIYASEPKPWVVPPPVSCEEQP